MMLVWWLNGLMKVNEMQVATSASSVTGSSPSLAAIPSATGVRIDAAAAFVIRFVMIVVVTANTAMTTGMLPAETCSIDRARRSANPLSTTTAPSPIEPARMNSTFQSRARTAARGVSTLASTMSTAPAKAISSTGARPNEAATTTATRTPSAIRVMPG